MKMILALAAIALLGLFSGCNTNLFGAGPHVDVEIQNKSSQDLQDVQAVFGDFVCEWGYVGKTFSKTYAYYPHPITGKSGLFWDYGNPKDVHRVERIYLSKIYQPGKSGGLPSSSMTTTLKQPSRRRSSSDESLVVPRCFDVADRLVSLCVVCLWALSGRASGIAKEAAYTKANVFGYGKNRELIEFMLSTSGHEQDWERLRVKLTQAGVHCIELPFDLGTAHLGIESDDFDMAKRVAVDFTTSNHSTLRLKARPSSEIYEVWSDGKKVKEESYGIEKK